MINHIKTLLANVSLKQAEDYGLSFYIDPMYAPFAVDTRTDKIRRDLVQQPGVSLNDALAAVFSVISRIDLVEHINRYDTRILEKRTASYNVFLGFDTDSAPVSFSVFSNKGIPEFLFSQTGDEDTDNELSKLKALWSEDIDGHTGLAACILALVARLDLCRSRNG